MREQRSKFYRLMTEEQDTICIIRDYGGGVERSAAGAIARWIRVITLNYDFSREWCAPRSLVSKAASFGRSCSLSAVNFNPKPTQDFACLTTASARIFPSSTRKIKLVRTPSALGSGGSINNPPILLIP